VSRREQITPSRFQVPPRPLGASHSTWTCPPDTSTFLSLPSAKNPMDLLSGDQKWDATPLASLQRNGPPAPDFVRPEHVFPRFRCRRANRPGYVARRRCWRWCLFRQANNYMLWTYEVGAGGPFR